LFRRIASDRDTFLRFLRDTSAPAPQGPAPLPASRRDPFRPTAHEVIHAGEIEQMAWRATLLHFGDMVEMRTLSHGGEVAYRQPGVAYEVQDGRHRGRIVGFWETGADRPAFQLRASSVEPQTARRIIRAVQLLGGHANSRPLHVRGWASHHTVGWARDQRLYRPERCATFRRNAEGLYCLYTRLLTAAELALVLENAAPEVRKFQALRRLQMDRFAERRRAAGRS
jgi:hypothetical protein